MILKIAFILVLACTSNMAFPDSNLESSFAVEYDCNFDSEESICLKMKIIELEREIKTQDEIIASRGNSTSSMSDSSPPGWSQTLVKTLASAAIVTTAAGPFSQLVQNVLDGHRTNNKPKTKDVSWAIIDLLANSLSTSMYLVQIYVQNIELTIWDYAAQSVAAVIEATIIGHSLFLIFRIKRHSGNSSPDIPFANI